MFSFAAVFSATAATGRVVKVLPLFLDQQGRHALSPSLFDRDAYQAQLRKNPEQRTAMRFDVLWRVRGEASGKLKLRLELRGMAHGNLPQEKTLETEVSATGLNRWSSIKLGGDDYKNFGEVTAWRVTLWDGDQQLGEQKSFLW
ncbi:MAG: hypothetical protein EPO07_11175 [Verrucomicrobia bacterium]|nr:MAG: hypothetical protein EPO07_11175 [Verrucomicrobiota bacterium]